MTLAAPRVEKPVCGADEHSQAATAGHLGFALTTAVLLTAPDCTDQPLGDKHGEGAEHEVLENLSPPGVIQDEGQVVGGGSTDLPGEMVGQMLCVFTDGRPLTAYRDDSDYVGERVLKRTR